MSTRTTNNITARVSITYEEFRQTKDDIDLMISNIKAPPDGQEQYSTKQIIEDLEELKYRFRDWSVENGIATYDSNGTYHEGNPSQNRSKLQQKN